MFFFKVTLSLIYVWTMFYWLSSFWFWTLHFNVRHSLFLLFYLASWRLNGKSRVFIRTCFSKIFFSYFNPVYLSTLFLRLKFHRYLFWLKLSEILLFKHRYHNIIQHWIESCRIISYLLNQISNIICRKSYAVHLKLREYP